MPYIKQEFRDNLDDIIGELATEIVALKNFDGAKLNGSLNYTITKLLKDTYGIPESQSYDVYNDIIGMLDCCKMEFYRKYVAPYEDVKEIENGKV